MKSVYVGSLPESSTEADLRTAFEAHGQSKKSLS